MMTKTIYFALITIALLFISQMSVGQCYNCDVQYPGGTFSTTSNSLTQVTSCAWAGEYSVYNVTAGETYTWTTCGGGTWDTQLTLFTGNTCGTGFIAYNDDDCGLLSTITWTATFTGQVNLLITQYNCQWNSNCMAINWACTSCGGGGNDITTCNGNFYDSGGPGSNYSNNENTVTTICPDAADVCVSVFFNSFNIENNWDFLTVYNGNSTASPVIGQYTGNALTGLTLQANNATGCLTFLFESDGSVTRPGWSATISCVGCDDLPPAVVQDCIGGTTVCSDVTFSGNSGGSGAIIDLNSSNQGCLGGGENQTSWYLFSPASNGNIGFTLSPNAGVDYDFAVWGPFPEGSTSADVCPPPGPPIRCSFASGFSTWVSTGSYNTGIGHNTYSAPQFGSPFVTYTEGAGGNGWVSGLNVTAGQVYVLVIDNWSSNSTPFSLNWNLQNGATLDCSPLPVELLDFSGQRIQNKNILRWKTATEINADFYDIERSGDGYHFESIGQITAAGNSAVELSYVFTDNSPDREILYYRLKQIDFNGDFEYFGPIAIGLDQIGVFVESPFPNPLSDGWLNIRTQLQHPDMITIQVFDLTGRALMESLHILDRGKHLLQIDLGHLASGAYQVHLSDQKGTTIQTARVVR